MVKTPPFLDDLSKLATNAMGIVEGLRKEIQTMIRARFDALLSERRIVAREEFDVVKAMAAKARQDSQDLKKRLAAVETLKVKASLKNAPKKPTAKKPAKKAKKPVKKCCAEKCNKPQKKSHHQS